MEQKILVSKDTLNKEATNSQKILFIINSGSGNNATDWPKEIEAYFNDLDHTIELYFLKKGIHVKSIKDKIKVFNPDKVVAVGGDGTVGLVAECLLQNNIPLGILPAGSANGLAKELGISAVPAEALHTIADGIIKKIHLTKVNSKLCIHLSDIGLNASMLKKFQSDNTRGVWGYIKAIVKEAWRVVLKKPLMQVSMTLDNKIIELKAAMIVIANATKYGTGAIINPLGSLEDDVFEVIVIKKISIREIIKMMITHAPYDSEKTMVFETNSLTILTRKKAYFQIDGEYLGKVNKIEAVLIPAALQIIAPS